MDQYEAFAADSIATSDCCHMMVISGSQALKSDTVVVFVMFPEMVIKGVGVVIIRQLGNRVLVLVANQVSKESPYSSPGH